MRWLFFLTTAPLLAACQGCGETKAQEPPIAAADAEGGPLQGQALADALDAGSYTGPYIAALFMHTPVMSDMDWPARTEDERKKQEEKGIVRMGYLRQGAKVPVNAEGHAKPNCPEGWYELLSGGFVCGKHASLDVNHPKVRTAAHAPWLDKALPYDYAFNIGNGTPLYRTLPAKADRVKYEPWLGPRKTEKTLESNPYATYQYDDAGVLEQTTLANVANVGDPLALGYDADGGLPWYLREWEGGKPTQITLDDLRGEGPILRRMVKGFYAAIDDSTEIEEPGKPWLKSKWWRSTYGYLAPFERMAKAKLLTDFHGIWLNGKPPMAYPEPSAQPDGGAPPYYVDKPPTKLPMAILLTRGKKYNLSADRKSATAIKGADGKDETLSRFTPVQLTGTTQLVGWLTFHETEAGFWVRAPEIVVMEPSAPPADLAPGEKWIDVNLTTQSLVAFEGTTPVFATLVSTGRKDKVDKEKNHETKPGTFRIREKHIAETMDADTATDGPYSIEDVPWIMYFNGSIALHGAFWHSNFGRQQSHGCVNLAPLDARALFFWSGPHIPDGWHSVWATPQNQGTRVIVHGDSLPK